MIKIQQHANGVTFSIRVHPKARLDGITGRMGDALKLDLTAPPVEGKANEACIRFFSDLLKVPRSSVTIAAGAASRNKVMRVSGISLSEVERLLSQVFQ